MMETQHVNRQTSSHNDKTSPPNDKPHNKKKPQDQENKDYIRRKKVMAIYANT